VRAIIVDNRWVVFDGITPEIEDLFYNHFAAKHARARFIDTNAGWDGVYRRYNMKKQSIARTFLPEVVKLCAERDVPLDIIDKRLPSRFPPHIDRIKRDMLSGIRLEDHQMKAIYYASQNELGILQFPTGAGKTEIMAGIVKIYDCPTVIIADVRVVIEQIFERLEARNVSEGVGIFYGGKTPNGQPVVVGSIQSLNSPPLELLKKKPDEFEIKNRRSKLFQAIVSKCELLIVDEADRSASDQYKPLINKYFNGRYRYGLSATPFDVDKPVANLFVRNNFGEIIAQAPRSEMQAIGRIIPIKYLTIVFGEDGNVKEKSAYDIAERELIVENQAFHARVAKVVASFPDDGTLIIVDTNNVEELGMALELAIPNSKFIYGKTSKSVRKRYIKEFEERKLKCLIGGKILKRGLDLKGGVENLIICGGGKLRSNFDQIVGRAVRNNERGWARVFSFFYLNNHYLYAHSRKQLKAIVDMGYDSKVVFKNTIIDGADFVKSKFRRPRVLASTPTSI
jgi:superfamily II DNA or RNA helicase